MSTLNACTMAVAAGGAGPGAVGGAAAAAGTWTMKRTTSC